MFTTTYNQHDTKYTLYIVVKWFSPMLFAHTNTTGFAPFFRLLDKFCSSEVIHSCVRMILPCSLTANSTPSIFLKCKILVASWAWLNECTSLLATLVGGEESSSS